MTTDGLSAALYVAAEGYNYDANGVDVWCPYVRNDVLDRTDPANGALHMPGAGKLTPADYQKAAAHAYASIGDRPLAGEAVAEAVRAELVAAHQGVDCSGAGVSILQEALGLDLFGVLKVSAEEVAAAYTVAGWTPDLTNKQGVLEKARDEKGLSVRHFAEVFRWTEPDYNLARVVDVRRLAANAQLVTEEVRAGDIAVHVPSRKAGIAHMAIVLDTPGHTVELVHSRRFEPGRDPGGIEFFEVPKTRALAFGNMTMRRLNFLK